MPVSKSSSSKNIQRKRKQLRFKHSIAMSALGCSVAVSAFGTHMQSNAFTAPASNTRVYVSPRTDDFTRVWYRDGDAEDSSERKMDHDSAASSVSSAPEPTRWWRIDSIMKQRDETPTEQQNIDEYLEFLDRRYNRLHYNENDQNKRKSQGRVGVNTAWNWIFDTSPDESQPQCLHQAMHEDALYVLGVAELASARLLQKHQVNQRRKQSQSRVGYEAAVIDIDDVNVSPTNEEKLDTSLSSTNVNRKLTSGLIVLKKLQDRKSAFIAAQVNSASQVIVRSSSVLLHKILSIIKVEANFMMKRLQATSTVALALATVLILQPLETLVLKNVCP